MNDNTTPPDTVTTHDGRVFEKVGSPRPHTRWDGTQIELHLWRGHCVLCGQPYDIAATANPSRGSLGVITCNEHRGMIRRIRRPPPRTPRATQ
jgi:hypothetical protein